MTETVKIGEHDVELRADGATPFLYKQAFKKDIIKMFTEAQNDISNVTDISAELGFIMAQQAKSPDPLKVDISHGAFMNWLMQFEAMDLNVAGMDIINVYLGSYRTDSVAKKKDDLQTES